MCDTYESAALCIAIERPQFNSLLGAVGMARLFHNLRPERVISHQELHMPSHPAGVLVTAQDQKGDEQGAFLV